MTIETMASARMRAVLLVSALGGALWSGPAWSAAAEAVTSDSGDSAEIIVTARKRQEKLFDVPGPVSAISQAQVENLRLFDARDLLSLTPSAFLQENNAGTARDISIRGVGTPTLFAEPGVALYVDDIYSSGFISYPTQFIDLERVEVLRGPQGALYGRNAVGGAVNVISKDPTDAFGASIKGTYASFDRFELQGTVNAPVAEGSGIRVSGWKFKQNHGEYFNPATGQYLDNSDTEGGRIVGKFALGPAVTLRLVGEHNEGDTAGTYLYFPTAGETRKTVNRDTQPTNSFNTTRISIDLGVKTGIGDFTLIAGGRNYKLNGVEDTDLSTDLFPTPTLSSLGQQITTRANRVESRFVEGRWLSPDWNGSNLLLGVSYLDDTATGSILTDLRGLSLAFSGGAAPFTLGIDNNQKVKSWSGFAEATIRVTDTVKLIGDLRYTSDDKSVDFLFTPSPTLYGFVGPSQSAINSRTFNRWSPGATLAWTPADDVRVYAKVQTGFRAGGYNFNVANAANLNYNSETSVNYEVGGRKRFDTLHASLGASVYYLDQKDVLVPFFDFTAPPGLQGYLANAGKARTYGGELEGSIEPVDGLVFNAALGALNGEFRDAFAGTTPLNGKQLPSARSLTTSLSFAYKKPVFGETQLLLNGSYTHRSSGYQDAANLFKIGGNNLVNLSAGLDFGHFDVLAFVQNLGNDRYDIAFGGNRNGESGVIQAQGRSFGVSARAKF